MEFTINKNQISKRALSDIYQQVEAVVSGSGATLQITDLLKILNFPSAVNQRIRQARGALRIACSNGICRASNNGRKVEEDIPGSGGALGIIIHEKFSCSFSVNTNTKTIFIRKIRGLDADIPGPLNADVDKIRIKLPNHVVLTI